MPLLRRVLLKPITIPGFAEALATLTRSRVAIFMLHRFSVPDLGVAGHDSNALRRALAHLRKQRYDLISLRDLFRKLLDGEPLKRAVAFTIDDGYFEHAHVAAPLFAEFDCPATTFVATDFIAGKTWYWFDRLRFIIEGTRQPSLRAHLGNEEIVYATDSVQSRAAAKEDLASRCKDATEQDRVDCVRQLSLDAEVDVPGAPPPQFAPLSWDDARSAEKLGMTFGPHTVTHPVLSTTSDAQSEFEIAESWRRLSAEVSRPDPIFCYPNGRRRDFGEREIATVRGLGLWGAVEGHNGDRIHPTAFRTSAVVRFRVPRFAYRDSLTSMLQCLSGVETFKTRIRGGVRK